MNEAIDVCLNVYKPNAWVFEAIESVLEQTYGNWKLIIVDDCTTNPGEMIDAVKKLSESDPQRISFHRLDSNRGPAGSMNEAIRAGSSEFVTWINQDDRWHPDRLQKLISCIRQDPEIGLVHSNLEGIDEEGIPIPDRCEEENRERNGIPYSDYSRSDLCRMLFRRNTVRMGTVLFRRNAFHEIGGLVEDYPGGEELHFIVHMSYRTGIRHIPENLTYRRFHSMNTVALFQSKRATGRMEMVTRLANEHPFLKPIAQDIWKKHYRSRIIKNVREGNGREAVELSRRLLGLSPLDYRSYSLFFLSKFGNRRMRNWILRKYS